MLQPPPQQLYPLLLTRIQIVLIIKWMLRQPLIQLVRLQLLHLLVPLIFDRFIFCSLLHKFFLYVFNERVSIKCVLLVPFHELLQGDTSSLLFSCEVVAGFGLAAIGWTDEDDVVFSEVVHGFLVDGLVLVVVEDLIKLFLYLLLLGRIPLHIIRLLQLLPLRIKHSITRDLLPEVVLRSFPHLQVELIYPLQLIILSDLPFLICVLLISFQAVELVVILRCVRDVDRNVDVIIVRKHRAYCELVLGDAEVN